MSNIKEGKFGRPRPELPKFVYKMIDNVTKGDMDWQQSNVEGDLWLVCKIWEDDESFNVLASKVVFESDQIELNERQSPYSDKWHGGPVSDGGMDPRR